MIANQTRAKTEQLAKTHWLITSARVLQVILERTAVWVRNISIEIVCFFSDEHTIWQPLAEPLGSTEARLKNTAIEVTLVSCKI